jgi:RES domain-containing protein
MTYVNGNPPDGRNHQVVRIMIPNEFPVETIDPSQVLGWDAEDNSASLDFGDKWFDERRTMVLRVPSVITQGREHNVVINTEHSQFGLIQAGPPEQVVWDARLFR